jgi:hypothetical protein
MTSKADKTMHTHPNLLLRLPKKKSTTPVTPQAAPNNCSDEASGNKPGNTTYPRMGKAPNVANDKNMTMPE